MLLPKVGSFNSDFLAIKNKYTARINKILSSNGIDLIAKYRKAELTKKGYLLELSAYNNIGQRQCIIESLWTSETIINNSKTQFIAFQSFKTLYCSFGNRYYPTYMTEDYYKLALEPILLRTCKHLASKDYVYDETVPELNGWLKFLKDITDIKIPQPDIKVYVMSFDFYRDMYKDDYKKLAFLEIFETRFKKELCKKASS